jgi:A/G-specific adenine glycosylase
MPDRDALVRDLLDWFSAHARELPWRSEPSPWRVLVAELMLQQTRIATVLPRYEAFLARFPDPASMAAAGEDEVLALWSGLGYYRRARNLFAAAVRITEDHGGEVPGDRAAVRALPGIGDYTAGALLSVAFGLPEPLVDGNVERVLSRIFFVTGNVKRGDARKRIRELAADLVTRGPPDRWNQALMELGALVCLPRSARCHECPAAAHCGALDRDRVDDLPEMPPKREVEEVRMAIGLVTGPAGTLFVRAPAGGFLAGTWMPPFAVVHDGEAEEGALERTGRDLGMKLRAVERLGTVRHTITHHRITATVFRADGGAGSAESEWIPEDRLAHFGVSSLAVKSLRTQLS